MELRTSPRPAKRRAPRLDTSRNASPKAAQAARSPYPAHLREKRGKGHDPAPGRCTPLTAETQGPTAAKAAGHSLQHTRRERTKGKRRKEFSPTVMLATAESILPPPRPTMEAKRTSASRKRCRPPRPTKESGERRNHLEYEIATPNLWQTQYRKWARLRTIIFVCCFCGLVCAK